MHQRIDYNPHPFVKYIIIVIIFNIDESVCFCLQVTVKTTGRLPTAT